MPKDLALKRRWQKALKSGKYKQGVGCLRDGDKYDALGVLLELVDGYCPEYGESHTDIYTRINKLLTSMGVDNHGYFVDLNDFQGFKFGEIADALDSF